MNPSNHAEEMLNWPHVVIVGGGFGGLYCAKKLAHQKVRVTLIDKRNFHLFQPLLYQVATGGLSAGDIASPLRFVFKDAPNVQTLMDEVIDVNVDKQQVVCKGRSVDYDHLVVAAGSKYNYFGNDQWEEKAPGLKTVEDALEIRHLVFRAFEMAEQAQTKEEQDAWLTFVIVGAGPTGVELAGALGELAHMTLNNDFHQLDTTRTKILLVEGMNRVLPVYTDKLSESAKKSLEKLGVTVQTGTFVTGIDNQQVTLKHGDTVETLRSKTIIWAAGIQAGPLATVLAKKVNAEQDRAGRILSHQDFSIGTADNLYVIGDMVAFKHEDGTPLPGVAPAAMQAGEYVAQSILAKYSGKTLKPFTYDDKGSLAVIGKNSAVGLVGNKPVTGFIAWGVWLLVHIRYLVEFDNKVLVLIQWIWMYFTRRKRVRLITPKHVVGSTVLFGDSSAIDLKKEVAAATAD